MKTIFGINRISKIHKPVLALGVFDGLHLAHRHILKSVVRQARKINGSSVVLTFWPHPQKKKSLYCLNHRLKLISELGIDICIVVNFNRNFAKITAKDFIANILVKKIGVSFLYLGKNFRFGAGARGDYKLLAKSAKMYNFVFKAFEVIESGDTPISSTAIRGLINKRKIKQAEKLLGKRVSVLGTVIRGSKLGRVLGFPTANIKAHHEIIPPPGIYKVQINLLKKSYNGICYIGSKPTMGAKNKSLHIEVHIFKFHKNIYGRSIEIQFVKLIRLEHKFASIEELAKQIKKDISFCTNKPARLP